MISSYDIVKSLKKANPDEIGYKLDESEKNIVNIKTGKIAFTVDDYTQHMRKELHCDFECIYHEHGTLTTIYRCRECGTVIFGGDDERYDPLLKCPDCGKYETSLEYWTQAEIDADEKKQNAIKFFHEMTQEMIAQAERKKKRGLNDWEIWKTSFKTKKGRINLSLECHNLFRTGLKGLHFEITKWKDAGGGLLNWKTDYYIPLSFSACNVLYHKRKMRKEIEEKKKLESKQV